MAARRALTVTIDFREAAKLADRLESVTGQARLNLAAVEAVNEVTRRAEPELRAGEVRDINLTETYVASKMNTTLATAKPSALIATRGDLTIMGHYPIEQMTQPTKTNRVKGDSSRGIPKGRKQAGLRVAIKRSSTTEQPKWFTMRLRHGTESGDKVGVFVRQGAKATHIYGPSPYSLFRFQAGAQSEEIAEDLRRTALLRMVDEVERAL